MAQSLSILESDCLYARSGQVIDLLGGNRTLPPPWVSQPDGSIRGGDNTTPLVGSLPIRSQRPGRKNSLSQRPCVRDQGEPHSNRGLAVVNINSLERDGLRQAELCSRNTMMI